jgi:SAM-dependent methyltransferase
MGGTPPLGAIALLSATALAYEVLLTRLFAIIQWHHFSSMIISLALLGYGASGSFLTLLVDRVQQRFAAFFSGNAVGFALSAVGSFLIAQQLPFNALEIGWDWRQLAYLLFLYLLLAIPFFCVANCFGLALLCYGKQIHRIYAFDLTGAGAGALGVILLLFAVRPATALLIVGALGLSAAGIALLTSGWWRWGLVGILGLLSLLACIPARWTALHLSDYKGLSQALRVTGAEVVAERSSPLGWVTVVRNRQVPFRYAPGLSLSATALPPEQLGLFSDGEALGAISRFTGRPEELAYLDYLTSALPYHWLSHPQVLVLGAGGGSDVLQAIAHGARRVDAVELNPQVVELVRHDFGDFAGGLFDRADVQVHIAEARGFVAGSAERYDLIQVALLDTFSTAAVGLYALSESYLYTVEAFTQYLRHLNPGGLLAVTRWLQSPPRDSLKLLATAITALERLGVTDPGQRLVLIRGWKTATLVVKNGAFNPEEMAVVKAFCRERSFDPAWYPGIQPAEVNRFNVLERPYLYEGAVALLGPARAAFLDRYKFDVRPATDDRPYFFRFFKWQTLPELLALRAHSGLGQLEWGYLVLVATLLQALLAGLVLILLPLWLGRRRALGRTRGQRWRVLVYFSAIGLGFLFLEIAFIQKFILFLSHPLYAVAVVLCAFLVFAGLGSAYSQRFDQRRAAVTWAVAGIAGMTAVYLRLLPPFFQWALAWPDPVKILCTVVLIAPLAVGMGMPFPLGLARVSRTVPGLVPWAWAINGCASVVSAVLATLLAIHIGFSGVVIAAVAWYGLAAVAAPRLA